MLEHHAELVPPQLDQLVRGRGQQVLSVEQHLAGSRLDQSRQAAHQRRLARARQAHDHEALAGADLEPDVGHGSDQAGRGEISRLAAPDATRRKAVGTRAEELPDAARRQLDRALGHRG